jgi:hypothetical protein
MVDTPCKAKRRVGELKGRKYWWRTKLLDYIYWWGRDGGSYPSKKEHSLVC